MTPHVLCVGGEDHDLRIPFMVALRARGFRVTAVGSATTAPFVRAGLEYHPFCFDRFVNPRSDWAAVTVLAKLFSELRPDLVQSFDTKPGLFVPLAARRSGHVRVVVTITGMAGLFSSRAPIVHALRVVYRFLHRRAARFGATTIFQNCVDQAYFERHSMADKATSRLIPGSGVDIDGFCQALASAPSPAELRETLGLGASEIVITVARLSRQKGIATLLKAAALIHRERPGVRFLLVGPRESEGPFAISQAEIARHAPYVLALGRRADVPALLTMADAFAFPTEYREGVPRALLEAALAGLPIVTTSMPGCCDVVRRWTGFVVPPRSPRALASRVLDILGDRKTAREMAARAAEHVRREFGLELTADRYAAVYREVLDERIDPPPATAVRQETSWSENWRLRQGSLGPRLLREKPIRSWR